MEKKKKDKLRNIRLKKPKKSVLKKFGVGKLNPTKAVMKGAKGYRLVREVEEKEPEEERRSLYFRESVNNDVEEERKWLLK